MTVVSGYRRGSVAGKKSATRREYTQIFNVQMSTRADSVVDVLAWSGLPSGQDYYSGDSGSVDSGAYLESLDASLKAEDDLWWEVKAVFAWNKGTSNQPVLDPLDEPTRYRYSAETQEEVAASGWSGSGSGVAVVIQNSVGDPFVPPPMKRTKLLVIRAVKNVAMSSHSTLRNLILTHMDTANADAFEIDGLTYPAGTLWLRLLDPDSNGEYVVFTMEFVYNRNTWVNSLMDRGFRATFSASLSATPPDPGLRRAMLSDCNTAIEYKAEGDGPVDDPIKLDGSGFPVGKVWPYDPSQPAVYLDIWTIERRNWSSLSGYLD